MIINLNILIYLKCANIWKDLTTSLFLFVSVLKMNSRKIDVFLLMSYTERINRTILSENNLLPHRLSPQVSQDSPVLLCFPKKTINSISLWSFETMTVSLLRILGPYNLDRVRGQINYICQWLYTNFPKIFLQEVLYFKTGFLFQTE